MLNGEKIRQILITLCNNNQSEMARRLGLSQPTINAWLKRNSIDYDKIASAFPELSAEWLLRGQGDMLKDQLLATVTYDSNVGTPYYDVDFMGGFCETLNNQTSLPTCGIIAPGFEKATVWCNVTGHSMEPKINHGDIIALRECTINDIQYGEIYAVVLDTIRTIKILRRGSSPDVLRYVPINSEYDEQEFPVSRIIRVFEVIGSLARFF